VRLADAYCAFCDDASRELRAVEPERRLLRAHAAAAAGAATTGDGASTLELWRGACALHACSARCVGRHVTVYGRCTSGARVAADDAVVSAHADTDMRYAEYP
jgi:hypothetical protein